MSSLGLFFPNRCTEACTYSGGSWLSELPASNVGTSSLAEVARSSNDANSSTILQVDMLSSKFVRAVAIVNHNFSSVAQTRISLGTSAGATDVYLGTSLPWLTGTFDYDITILGMEDDEYIRDGNMALCVFPATYQARHVKIEIFDDTNPDGYVQIGRVFAGGGIIPTYNADYGLRDSWIDLSTSEQSESGAEWVTARRRLRQVDFVLDGLSLTEGEYLHEMQRVLGTIDEVLYVPDMTSNATSQRFGFLGTMREMTALEYPYYRLRRLPLSLKQKG